MALNLEDKEQAALISWADLAPHPTAVGKIGDYLYAIPNGSHKSPAAAAKFKATGLRAGVPDLCLAYPDHGYSGLYIELKKQRQHFRCKSEADKAVSPEQRTWLARLALAGYKTAVSYGWEEARAVIEGYLRGR